MLSRHGGGGPSSETVDFTWRRLQARDRPFERRNIRSDSPARGEGLSSVRFDSSTSRFDCRTEGHGFVRGGLRAADLRERISDGSIRFLFASVRFVLASVRNSLPGSVPTLAREPSTLAVVRFSIAGVEPSDGADQVVLALVRLSRAELEIHRPRSRFSIARHRTTLALARILRNLGSRFEPTFTIFRPPISSNESTRRKPPRRVS